MIDLDELLRLDAARTKGEWRSYCGEGPIRYPAPDRQGWTNSVCIGGHDDGHVCVGTVCAKDEDQAHVDACVIAGAVNALGPLVKIAKAARELVAAPPTSGAGLNLIDVRSRLVEALRAAGIL